MNLIRKINQAYFFYNYCYAVTWQYLWKKRVEGLDQLNGSFFPIVCFILYIFLLAVILWRCGVHARQSGPVMLWLNLLIMIYGIYLGFQKKLCASYFPAIFQLIPL